MKIDKEKDYLKSGSWKWFSLGK